MPLALQLHPDSVCDAVTRIEVGVARLHPAGLALTYIVSGTIADLCLPPQAAPARAEELWRRTCFEAFVRPARREAYCEFNFAPSTQWAAYRFEGYRSGMSAATAIGTPHIALELSDERLTLHASLDLDLLRAPDAMPWRLGLSAVIEERNSRMSYWALAHPPGKADFHHSDCFVLELS